MAEAPRVRMFSRSVCGLCDEARRRILALGDEVPFEFEEVRIDGDDALEREYGLRVPVIEVNGAEEFEYEVDPDQLRGLLRSA